MVLVKIKTYSNPNNISKTGAVISSYINPNEVIKIDKLNDIDITEITFSHGYCKSPEPAEEIVKKLTRNNKDYV